MKYRRMPIEVESPEELGYGTIRYNLAESSVTDAKWSELGIDLNEIILAYGDHRGKTELREWIAAQHENISADDVLITAGAAAALFIVNTSLLEKNDHLVVQFPNYATNLETPFAIGCGISKAELKFENDFHFSANEVIRLCTQQTKLISMTTPHNPTGTVPAENELLKLVRYAEEKNIFLLVDETYRDLVFGNKLPLAATLSQNVISVSSVSKAHGLPGIRMGWLITKNEKLKEIFLAAKEQIFICNSGVDEEIAFQYLQRSGKRLDTILQSVRENFDVVKQWMHANEFFEWVKPDGGTVCFPRFKNGSGISTEKFYGTLYKKYETYVGPGHWFGMDDRYIRIGFGWPRKAELEKGLENILLAAKEAANRV